MTHTLRTRRLLVLTASAALAAGGALIPTTASAAPAPAKAETAVTQTSHQRAGAVHGYVNDDYCYAGEDAYYVYYDYCDVYWG
ncbi:hypothetical protein [Actinacidiphila sp. bgisy160]|uniref:hypothetical protein n=1 Tax=Actinacidiphila sp. bgisy160 TaxID=3413796 RepID=UPI003D756E29